MTRKLKQWKKTRKEVKPIAGNRVHWLCCMETLYSRVEKQEISQLERKTSTTDRHSAATKGA